MWNFKRHSPADYWVILPQKWTKLPLKLMVIFIFLKFGMVKLFETLQTVSNMKINIFQIKIFNEITLLLFMIYSFIKFKVLVSLPKSSHGPLGITMHCNWPTDHAIDHSSIGLKRLTIQLVFNEVSLFTFSKGTHGFDVTVPKNYLKDKNVMFLLVFNGFSFQQSCTLHFVVFMARIDHKWMWNYDWNMSCKIH